MRTRILLVCSLSLLLTLAACGDSGTTTAPPPAATPGGGMASVPAPTGSVAGKIIFEGTPPAPKKIQMTADPYCAKNSKDPFTEEVKVSDGGLEHVIVYVSSPVSGSFPTPTEAVEIDQHDCHYVPHAFTVMVNQPLKVKNSDET